jgi:hypothetical protein
MPGPLLVHVVLSLMLLIEVCRVDGCAQWLSRSAAAVSSTARMPTSAGPCSAAGPTTSAMIPTSAGPSSRSYPRTRSPGITASATVIAGASPADVSASTDETMTSPAVVIAPVVPRADT